MERCLKVALSVVLLAACLHAKPVCQQMLVNPLNVSDLYDLEELGLDHVKKVFCGANVTFISPNNVDENCLAVALESFKDGLEQAKANCTDDFERIIDAQSYLTNKEQDTARQCVTSETFSQCQWSEKKPLGEFLDNFITFVQVLNAAKSAIDSSASS